MQIQLTGNIANRLVQKREKLPIDKPHRTAVNQSRIRPILHHQHIAISPFRHPQQMPPIIGRITTVQRQSLMHRCLPMPRAAFCIVSISVKTRIIHQPAPISVQFKRPIIRLIVTRNSRRRTMQRHVNLIGSPIVAHHIQTSLLKCTTLVLWQKLPIQSRPCSVFGITYQFCSFDKRIVKSPL